MQGLKIISCVPTKQLKCALGLESVSEITLHTHTHTHTQKHRGEMRREKTVQEIRESEKGNFTTCCKRERWTAKSELKIRNGPTRTCSFIHPTVTFKPVFLMCSDTVVVIKSPNVKRHNKKKHRASFEQTYTLESQLKARRVKYLKWL